MSTINALKLQVKEEDEDDSGCPIVDLQALPAEDETKDLHIALVDTVACRIPGQERLELLLELHIPRLCRPVLALFDSGAQVSMLSSDFEVGANLMKTPPLRLTGASGSRLLITGVCQELFLVAGRMFQHQFVLGHISFDAILGADFQQAHSLHVDWMKKGIRSQVDRDFFAPLIQNPHPTPRIALIEEELGREFDKVEDYLYYERSTLTKPPDTIISSDLSPEDQATLNALLSEFAPELGRSRGKFQSAQFAIELLQTKRIACSPRRESPPRQAHISRHLQEMLEDGIAVPSRSPFASPVTLVSKSDGSYRFCIDYRALNAITKRDSYPLPNQDDLLAAFSGFQYFAKLDLKSGYWQIPMVESDREKTAFVTQEGLFEFTVMPFGLCNAPAAFQRAMNESLAGLINRICFCYIDDLIIGGHTVEELTGNLQAVFQRLLREEGLALNLKKCRLGFTRLPFLGHIISAEGIEPDPGKVEAIRQVPSPKNTNELRRFLGLMGYYRRFIRDMSSIARPLELLLRKSQPWTWTDVHQEAFEKLKAALVDGTILLRPDYTRPFVIHTDASNVGLGAVLTQQLHGDGEQPLQFASRSLSPAEANYHAREKECLAVKWALRKFAPFVEGCPDLTVVTDHESLKWLMSQDKPTGKIARWVLELQATPLKIIHRPGSLNIVADTLSRAFPSTEVNVVTPCMPDEDLIRKQQADEWVKGEITAGRAWLEEGIAHSKVTIGPVERTVTLIPEGLRESTAERVHTQAGHFGINGTYDLLRRRYSWPKMRNTVKQVLAACRGCTNGKHRMGKAAGLMGNRQLEKFNQCAFLDLLGPLIRATAGKEHVLIIVDGFSRWVELTALASITSARVARAFDEEWCCRYGYPEVAVTDNGRQFTGSAFTDLCRDRGVRQAQIAPYHPQANLSERLIRDVKQCLRVLMEESGRQWVDLLQNVAFSLRCKVNASTGFAPSELILGMPLRLPGEPQARRAEQDAMAALAVSIPSARENDAKAITNRRLRYNAHRTDWEPAVGDLICVTDELRRHALEPLRRGPFRIEAKVGPASYRILDPLSGQSLVRHIHKLLPFKGEMV